MKQDLLSHLWRIDTTDADMKILRWSVLAMCAFLSYILISQLVAGRFLLGVANFGLLLCFFCYAIGPQCFGIIEAAERSSSRKALTILVLIGFLVYVGASIADLIG